MLDANQTAPGLRLIRFSQLEHNETETSREPAHASRRRRTQTVMEGFCPARCGPGRRRYRFAVARMKTIEIKIEEKETNVGNGCSDQEAHPIPRIRRFLILLC